MEVLNQCQQIFYLDFMLYKLMKINFININVDIGIYVDN
jgi:hypothetical protein